MRIIFTQIVLPIICYFIGVYIGDRRGFNRAWDTISEAVEKELKDYRDEKLGVKNEEIQHVEYTPEQMGYDK